MIQEREKKNKPISLEERKAVQLEMLKEIDSFCRENDIKYSLAFGTLLGAIRHKGFIPWDDDVDIMMPLPDMLRFKELFHSDRLKYCDVDTAKHFEYGFSRIANVKTYNKRGLTVRDYGICIDLYPLVSVPSEPKDNDLFFERASELNKRRFFFMKWNSRIIRVLPVESIPGLDGSIKRYRDFILNTDLFGKTGKYYIVAGPLELRDKMSYEFNLFDNMIEVVFEGNYFKAIAEYDHFLSLRYGDYMQLPPEDQRHPYHSGLFYWKI